MNARRDVLTSIKIINVPSANAGLWLDRYFEGNDDPKSRSNLVKEVSQVAIPDSYTIFYQRWENLLETMDKTKTHVAKVKGRMIVGLGNEGVLETSVTLHRIYGTPYIPGSAIKGLAASYAQQRLKWQSDEEAFKIIFGDTDDAGYITFFDALYKPEIDHNKQSLYPDVITVHHQMYYQDAGKPPADWDDPNPVPFLSATGSYLIALAAPGLDNPQPWLNTAFDILQHALIEMGIGAKTSSGYGRMEMEIPPPPPIDPDLQKAESYKKDIEKLSSKDVAGQIYSYYQKWQQLSSENGKNILARAIVDKIRQVGREKASVDKKWYQELAAFLEKADQSS